jgi:hypothetical protein
MVLRGAQKHVSIWGIELSLFLGIFDYLEIRDLLSVALFFILQIFMKDAATDFRESKGYLTAASLARIRLGIGLAPATSQSTAVMLRRARTVLLA